MSVFRLAKSVTDLSPRSTHSLGHSPLFNLWRSWCKSVKVLLWRSALSLGVNMQSRSMCVLVSGD